MAEYNSMYAYIVVVGAPDNKGQQVWFNNKNIDCGPWLEPSLRDGSN